MKAKGSLIKQEGEVDVTPEEIEGFKKSLVPGFVKHGIDILTNEVEFRKWKREQEIKLLKRAHQQTLKNHIPIKPIPLKVFKPLLENAVLEEDESMQAKWSNLLANAASGNIEVKPAFAEILKGLSPIEVSILDNIYDEAQKEQNYEERMKIQYDKETICSMFPISSEDFDVMLENLIRLNLCRYPGAEDITFGHGSRTATITTEGFELTALGFRFIRVCRPPQPQ